MTEVITQLGVGGIFSILVIREVLGYLKARKEVQETNGGNGSAGRRSTDFWINVNRDIMSKVLIDSVIPILQQNARILDEIRVTNARHTEIMLKLQFVNERIDASLQTIIEHRKTS